MNDNRYMPLEFSYYYLKEIMGFDEFYIARAQGTPVSPEDEILDAANKDLNNVFDAFYTQK